MPAMPSGIKEIPVQLPKSFDRPDEPWHHYLTIDLIWYVFGYTIFHPFVSWVVVLCLRAQYTPYGNLEMRLATAWAMLMTIIGLFNLLSDRIAFGLPREVDLAEEVIVVTGGVEGLGALLAETYGMRNANIAVLDTKKVDDEVSENTGVLYYECDVSDAQQVEAAAAQIVEDLGAPTILINNAGVMQAKSVLDSTAEEVERTFRVNTLAHFNTLRTFVPHMLKEGRGTIVTVASVLGHLGAANLSAYTASKAALLALHQSLRAELAQNPDAKHIKTILVTPGQMGTRMFAGLKTPSNFLAPIVTPAEIGKDIIRMIEKGDSGEIAIPLYSRYIQVLGVLPFGVQYLIRKWSGMDKAVGHMREARQEPKEKN
ncbi:hypothetical protein COCC4DRAFT_192271 [Bipolaris maydis ATCC 48331]|uniref:Short-chain dehydrogenase/reductase 3 n=2 Tax=Cochliobolus heterostrophus TaxID=5016 RepID=M2UZJ2_COCH5|nr:uncharacterized protein COCC4DRAFT_192271 [Bipolaris maydis ATCC 48331]EMD93218.1 hypothetical protein COCHEDRAFT_1131258 [Bipolaris maydis C5]KAJ5027559.1 hypothetical protein J3E73DRAFT_430528 [Bipolaris maydis]ENI07335.1 hypothetical protein COCC4DRAFT_192271 [Bipolaris maydis ATCC 48331]KAJ5062312.1 short chain dehydrogenase/reductase [Bipolaris maydis]KAJ6198589.1 short chain dehydrogenase/reductase [Bipolaris maydis]